MFTLQVQLIMRVQQEYPFRNQRWMLHYESGQHGIRIKPTSFKLIAAYIINVYQFSGIILGQA